MDGNTAASTVHIGRQRARAAKHAPSCITKVWPKKLHVQVVKCLVPQTLSRRRITNAYGLYEGNLT